MSPWLPKLDVAAAMHHGFVSCSLDTPLATVARMMASYRIHAVLVTTHGDDTLAGGRHWGIVSDVALIRAAERGVKTAREAAEAPALTLSADDELEQAARVLTGNEASHLIVLDPLSHRPVGVLSTLDLVRVLAG